MSKGIFTEKKKKPNLRTILEVIGPAKDDWKRLTDILTGEYKTRGDLRFYGKNYGWAMRFSRSGKSIAALYPNEDHFMVQVILNRPMAKAALASGISAETKKVIRSARQFPEGKWIYIPVSAGGGSADAEEVVRIRAGIKGL